MANLPCLPLIQERFWNAIKDKLIPEEKKYYPDFRLYMFPQTWDDTSLGFGGIGGQAITTAYTTVIIESNNNYCGVFFNERLAYVIKNPNSMFWEDIQKHKMSDVAHSGKYKRKE